MVGDETGKWFQWNNDLDMSMGARRQWEIHFDVLKQNNRHPGILRAVTVFLRMKIKYFFCKQELSITNKLFAKNFICLFYFWLCWVFVAAHRISLVAASGGYSLLQCTGCSSLVDEQGLQGPQASVGAALGLSSCPSQALECRLSGWCAEV